MLTKTIFIVASNAATHGLTTMGLFSVQIQRTCGLNSYVAFYKSNPSEKAAVCFDLYVYLAA